MHAWRYELGTWIEEDVHTLEGQALPGGFDHDPCWGGGAGSRTSFRLSEPDRLHRCSEVNESKLHSAKSPSRIMGKTRNRILGFCLRHSTQLESIVIGCRTRGKEANGACAGGEHRDPTDEYG